MMQADSVFEKAIVCSSILQCGYTCHNLPASCSSIPVDDRKGCCSAKALEAGSAIVMLAAAAHAINADMNLSLMLG